MATDYEDVSVTEALDDLRDTVEAVTERARDSAAHGVVDMLGDADRLIAQARALADELDL